MERDITLDRLRSIAVIWLIFFHFIYWSDIVDDYNLECVKSFLLFEMPLFFFITGASNSFSKTTSYKDFIYKKLSRILVPYYVYAVICLIVIIPYFVYKGKANFMMISATVISWLFPVSLQITPLNYLDWALWFIPVYVIIMLVFPLLKGAYNSKYKYLMLLVLLLVFEFAGSSNILTRFKEVTFYIIWTYLGLFYTRMNRGRKYLVAIFGAVSLLLVLIYRSGCLFYVQLDRFPEDNIFLVCSVWMFSLLFLCLPYIMKIFDKFRGTLDLFSKRSMTVYLYHSFAFLIVVPVVDTLIQGRGSGVLLLKLFIFSVLIYPLCILFVLVFGRFENIKGR